MPREDVFHTDGHADVWCVLDEDYDIQRLHGEEPVPTHSVEHELANMGFDSYFPDRYDSASKGYVTWALQKGLTIGQPFLVRFHKPRYWQDYWGEWDAETFAEIVHIDPWPVEKVIADLEDWIARGLDTA